MLGQGTGSDAFCYPHLGIRWLLICSILLAIAGCGGPAAAPSDEDLLRRFGDHRSALNEIERIAHSNEPGTQAISGSRHLIVDALTIPQQAHYKDLVNEVGVGEGSFDEKGNYYFEMWGDGCAPCNDYFKGYAYLENSPSDIIPTLNGYDPQGEIPKTTYRHIVGHWYLYFQYLP